MITRMKNYTTEIVTFMPRLPLSANNCAIDVSNTRQSEFKIAAATPSWLERGIASQVKRRRFPFNSKLENIYFPLQILQHSTVYTYILYKSLTDMQSFLLVFEIRLAVLWRKIVYGHQIFLASLRQA